SSEADMEPSLLAELTPIGEDRDDLRPRASRSEGQESEAIGFLALTSRRRPVTKRPARLLTHRMLFRWIGQWDSPEATLVPNWRGRTFAAGSDRKTVSKLLPGCSLMQEKMPQRARTQNGQ